MIGPRPLAEAADPRVFGSKAAGLAAVFSAVPVPPGVALPGSWLAEFLPGPQRDLLSSLLQQLPAVADSELGALVSDIQDATATLSFDGTIAVPAGSVVVRSSSTDEDDASLSFAGVFDSVVNVAPADVADAVHLVWRSGFAAAALLQYRRLGRTPLLDHMSVLVQQAVSPVVAGVAFTEASGAAFVEWVAGHGENLVGGLAAPVAERLTDASAGGWRADLQALLTQLPDSDVEWAFDGARVWIVQVRPRTADLAGTSTPAGIRAVPLYEGDVHDLGLGDLGDEYDRIRAKRRLPRAIALSQGAQVPAGWLVNWSPTGPADALARWGEQLPARLVLDSSPAERQYIVDRAELGDVVRRLAANRPRSSEDFAFLCREYIHGDTALLSTVAADGSVFVEASEQGLLALNRGFGSARPLPDHELVALVGSRPARALADTTREFARRAHPRATLEWVVTADGLYFVDYSAPVGTAPAAALGETRVLSPGLAAGRVQHLDIDEVLTESSIAPIISIAQPVTAENHALLLDQLRERLSLDGADVIVAAARPIAVLSILIGVVGGFLFEEGALLSHLGILLREAGVPAAIVGTGNLPPHGSRIELVHGAVLSTAAELPGLR